MSEKKDLRDARIAELEEALRSIEAWEMPPSGRFWEDDRSHEMPYASAFGSQGERAVIRDRARAALSSSRHKP